MPGNQSATQSFLQNIGQVQTNAQANAPHNTASPNTTYNFPIPTQSNAAGQWWVNPSTLPRVPVNYNYDPVPVEQKVQYPTNIPTPTLPAWQRPADTPLPAAVTNLLGFFNKQQLPLPVNQPVPPGQTPPPATGGGGGVDISQPAPIDNIPRIVKGRDYVGDGGGGGLGDCVASSMFLSPDVQAQNITENFKTFCHKPEEGFKEVKVDAIYGKSIVPCVELVTEGGARLTCSEATPFTFVGASADLHPNEWAYAPDMIGKLVYVIRNGQVTAEKVIAIAHKGPLEVVKISFGGRSFPAGNSPDAMIYSHNLMKAFSGAGNIAHMQDLLNAYTFAPESSFFASNPAIGGANPYATQPAGASGATSNGTGTTGSQTTTTVDSNGNLQIVPLTNLIPTNTNQTPVPSWWNSFTNSITSNLVPRNSDGTVNWGALLGEVVTGLPMGGSGQ